MFVYGIGSGACKVGSVGQGQISMSYGLNFIFLFIMLVGYKNSKSDLKLNGWPVAVKSVTVIVILKYV